MLKELKQFNSWLYTLKQFNSWLYAEADVVLTERGMPTVLPISPMLQNAYDIYYFC
jgi:hypothetical protein